jgi:RHS repeat-associated protein
VNRTLLRSLINLNYIAVDKATNRIAGFTYDAAGNLTNDGTHTYTYDAEGNLTQVDGGSTANYSYDGLNRRVQTVVNGVSTLYAYNLNGQRVASFDGSGNLISNQVYAGSTPIAFYQGGQIHYQHQDWLGTERVRTDGSGNVEGTYTSLPIGDGYSATGSDNDAYHYGTLDHDSETDTQHAQFRQYSSTQGRWLSPDPSSESYDFADPQSLNRYAYVQNNPLAATDPSGQMMNLDDSPANGGLPSDAADSPACDGDAWFCENWPACLTCGAPIAGPFPPVVISGTMLSTSDYGVPYPGLGTAIQQALGVSLNPGCEFGACGGIIFDEIQQNGQNPSVEVNCRQVEAWNLGSIFGANHCDASVSIGDGYFYSISAGPINGRLRGFVTQRKTQTTGETIYYNAIPGDVSALGRCVIAAGRASQASKKDKRYNFLFGPNSNNWINGIFSSCGVDLGLGSVVLGPGHD